MISFDYSPQAQRQQAELIRESLNSALTDSTDRLYLLIDPVSLPEESDHPFVSALVAQRPQAVRLPHNKLSAAAHPWLVTIDASDDAHVALLEQSIAYALEELHPEQLSQGKGRAVCGWLTSSYDADTVARQLGETAIQRLLDNSLIWLRYYDPAVNSVLCLFLNTLQQQRLLGVIHHWLYVNGDGQPVMHQHTPSAQPHYTFSLALSDEDANAIALVGKTNRTLERYRLHRQNAPRHKETEASNIVRAALERAASVHGFTAEADQQSLALDCLHWHPQFDMHPDMRVLLCPQERNTQVGYIGCTQSLTNSIRQKMCDELNVTAAVSPTYRRNP